VLNGGPTKSRFWNQITANVVNRPLKVPDIGEAAPVGDAVLAATAAGIYSDPVTPLKDIVRIKETIDPDPTANRRYLDFFEEWRGVYQSLVGCMDRHRTLLEKYAVN
jgi:xylulokinase